MPRRYKRNNGSKGGIPTVKRKQKRALKPHESTAKKGGKRGR
jgi:hypothetical protein